MYSAQMLCATRFSQIEFHRALLCDDILTDIFHWLFPFGPDEKWSVNKVNRKTLLSCSRVSKAFSHHALNVLWEQMGGIQPVLKILQVFKVVPFGEDVSVAGCAFHFTGPIANDDLCRFRCYAQRIRVLAACSGKSPEARIGVLSQLSAMCGGVLFPALRELTFNPWDYADKTILYLVSPCLRRLLITRLVISLPGDVPQEAYSDDAQALHMILQSVSSKVIQLRDFQVIGRYHPFALAPITGCKHLTRIDMSMDTIDNDFLQPLSRLHNLIELNVWLHADTDDEINVNGGFKSLQALALSGRLTAVTKLLSTLSNSPLRAIHVKSVVGDPDDLHHCLDMIASHFAASLSEFHFQFDEEQDTGPWVELWKQKQSLVDLLQPLTGAHKLQVLEASLFPIHLHDGDVAVLASAWPCLEVLEWHVVYLDDVQLYPAAPFTCLVEVAKCFPYLCRLVLPALSFTPPLSMSSVSHPLPTLHALILDGEYRNEIAQDPMGAACVIDALFPELDPAEAWETEEKTIQEPDEPDSAWKQVLRALAQIHTIRERELSGSHVARRDSDAPLAEALDDDA